MFNLIHVCMLIKGDRINPTMDWLSNHNHYDRLIREYFGTKIWGISTTMLVADATNNHKDVLHEAILDHRSVVLRTLITLIRTKLSGLNLLPNDKEGHICL